MDHGTGEIVAEFVDPYISTYDFADEVANAGKYLFKGGRSQMFLGWEVNGPGEDWHRDLRRNNYTAMYFQRAVAQAGQRRSKAYGWRSDRQKKLVLLRALDRAITRGDIIIPSQAGLNEMLEYVRYEDGSIGPGHLRDELSGARESHGDRVIAYGGCVFMRAEVGKYEEEPEQDKPGTFGHFLGMAQDWQEIMDEVNQVEEMQV